VDRQAQKDTERWAHKDLEGYRQMGRQAQKDKDRWTDRGAGFRERWADGQRKIQTGAQTQTKNDIQTDS
jgi:hypothetical protein